MGTNKNKNMSQYNIQKKISTVLGISLALASFTLAFSNPAAEATGLDVSLTPSQQDVSTNADLIISFTPTTAITNGSSINVAFPAGYVGGSALADADITVSGTNIVSTLESSFSDAGFSSVITSSANVTASITITIGGVNKLTSPVSADNYAFSIITSVGDNGGAFQYVGDANRVEVRAFVPSSLSFAIRDASDTVNTNVCDMGTLSTAAVGSCSYRLKVGTNASNGYTVSVATTGDFTSGANTFANANIGTGGTAIVAGTEGYGAIVDGGSATTGTVTVANAYNAGATNSVQYNNTTTATLLTSDGPNSPAATGETTNSSLVTHNAGIDPSTAPGLYTQTVTYTVNPSF
jgi:hypothetical protein